MDNSVLKIIGIIASIITIFVFITGINSLNEKRKKRLIQQETNIPINDTHVNTNSTVSILIETYTDIFDLGIIIKANVYFLGFQFPNVVIKNGGNKKVIYRGPFFSVINGADISPDTTRVCFIVNNQRLFIANIDGTKMNYYEVSNFNIAVSNPSWINADHISFYLSQKDTSSKNGLKNFAGYTFIKYGTIVAKVDYDNSLKDLVSK